MRKYKNGVKTSHKILFTILSFIGMLGLTFGTFVFLVLGNESNAQVDTVNSESEKVTHKDIKAVTAQVNPKPAVSSLDHVMQADTVKVDTAGDVISYTVKAGDSLSAISSQYQVSMASIMQQNDLSSAEAISIGQVLTFSKDYVVKEEIKEPLITGDAFKAPEVSINNGNKVVAGGLSDEERTYVLTQLQTRTGVDASQWDYIISRESGWIATIKNSLGYYGLFQLAPSYPGYDGDLNSQIEGAIYLFNNGGMTHWAL